MGGTVIETESERLIRQGKEDERYQTVRCMLQRGKTPKEISDFCEYDLSYVKQVEESIVERV